MTAQPVALVVQNARHEGPGWLESWLATGGVGLRTVAAYAGEPVPTAPDGYAGVICLGGPMGVADDQRARWLPDLRRLLTATLEADRPLLGVCLGAQLLAAAAGGLVETGTAGPELGLGEVDLCPGAADDPLLAGVPSPAGVVQWHWDAVSRLPVGAVPLARSTAYPHQAFRLGQRAWGLQFHVETTLPMLAQWAQDDAGPVRAAGLDPVSLVGEVAEHDALLRAQWRRFGERLAALLVGT